jgi:hypothetical protein
VSPLQIAIALLLLANTVALLFFTLALLVTVAQIPKGDSPSRRVDRQIHEAQARISAIGEHARVLILQQAARRIQEQRGGVYPPPRWPGSD